jgi:DNA helicase-2/ATP-dependent DNA helicase PcrA
MAMSYPNGQPSFDAVFDKLIQHLNAAQKEAIERLDGPTLVLAGPGTGKTQLIAAKVGTILMESDTLPKSILCLTFTDAGVNALRSRLVQFIGPEGLKVQVLTFHAFCNQIIQQNRYHFGQQHLEPVSALESIDIVRKLLDALPWDNLLKKGYTNAYQFERELQSLFRWMKMENFSPSFLLENITAYCNQMSSLPEFRYKRKQGEFNAGDLKIGMYHDFLQKYLRLKEGILLFDEYEKEKIAGQRYDYEDMLLWVLKAFQEKPYFLSLYQEQFLYVLLDEFQDTNGAQFELVQTLLNYWDTPNLFIVGDEDQSIYEFQGARIKHLQQVKERYGEALHLVQLNENYRSTQGILNAAFAFIQRNTLRSSLKNHGNISSNPLVAASDLRNIDAKPLVVEYESIFQEEADLVGSLKSLIKKGVNPGNIAVIFRNNRQGDRLVKLFEKNGLPYHTTRPINILQSPIVLKILRLLQYLVLEWNETDSGEAVFLPLLYHAHWEINISDIGRLNRFKATSGLSWLSILGDESIWMAAGVENAKPIKRLYRFFQEALKKGFNTSLPSFLEFIIHKSGLLRATLKQKDSVLQVQILNTLMHFCEQSVEREPNIRVIDWMLMMERMQDNHLPLALEMPQVSKDSIHLLTAHRSKGLEFEYVFLYDNVQAEWEGKGSHTGVFSFPPTLKMEPETDELEASRRLFYVAMTRASRFLQMGFSNVNAVGKLSMPTLFITELLADKWVDVEKRAIPEADMNQIRENNIKPILLPPSFRPDKAFIEHKMETFMLTVSSLNRFLNCPLSFFYRDVLGIQASKNVASIFGSAIHDALFEWTSDLKYAKKTEDKKLPDLFEKYLKRSRSWFSKNSWDNHLHRGKACLNDFVSTCDIEKLRRSTPELSIRYIDEYGYKYKGVLDRVDDVKGGKVHLVDYKTGKPKRNTFQKPSWKGNNPYGGVYWRQLAFYHLLFEGHNPNGLLVEETKLIFPEEAPESSSREVIVALETEDLIAFKNLIRDVHRQIQAQDFYRGCGSVSCVWCNYLNNEILPDHLEHSDHLFLDDGHHQ